MPTFFSIPLELREEIYRKVLDSPLVPKPSLRPRKRISKAKKPAEDAAINMASSATESTNLASDESALPMAINTSLVDGVSSLTTQGPPETQTESEYYEGEEAVRYSLAKPLPPTHSILRTCRQFRAEMLAMVHRSELRYKLRLAFREDKDIIYPTWLSVPALSDRIDVLDVEIRIRHGRTSSLFSAANDDEREVEGDVAFGGMVLLQRFLERGVDFLAKKKAQKITVGLLLVRIVPKDLDYRDPKDLFEETAELVRELLVGDWDKAYANEETRAREDEMIRFFAQRIDRFAYLVGEERKEWNMREVIEERDRLMREKALAEVGVEEG